MTRLLVIITILLAIVGCSDTKSLPGGYELMKWEDGVTFYITGPGSSNQDGGGVIEGTVKRIAWNIEHIYVERYATFRGDPDGWMIIDTKSKKVSGPISEAEFKSRIETDNLQVKTVQEAWATL